MSFQQGLSGLNAAAKNLDVIGNNIANSTTVGFKGSEVEFADVFANSAGGSSGASVGIGTAVGAVKQTFGQGNIQVTSSPLDIAINGSGFFRMDTNGSVTYTRNGQFSLDKNGYIVNSTGQNLTGYPASASGGVTSATPVALQVSAADLAPSASTSATAGVTLDSRSSVLSSAAFNLSDPTTYQGATSMSVYDSLGNQHILSLYFVKTAANTWDAFAANDGVQIGAAPVTTLGFNSSGTLTSGSTAALTLPVTTGAANISLALDLAGTSQFGSAFGVNSLSQDGYAAGKISGYSVGGDGIILGRYTNGQSRAQGQIVLSSFTNPQGLQSLGGNQWAEAPASGPALIGAPSTGNLGALQSGALEESNIDLTAELVDMITAQRVYQSNAQTIKTQDSVLQTLVNLR
jgi:flagellar hook protein FlgE